MKPACPEMALTLFFLIIVLHPVSVCPFHTMGPEKLSNLAKILISADSILARFLSMDAFEIQMGILKNVEQAQILIALDSIWRSFTVRSSQDGEFYCKSTEL